MERENGATLKTSSKENEEIDAIGVESTKKSK
jgi:hypothetical protein